MWRRNYSQTLLQNIKIEHMFGSSHGAAPFAERFKCDHFNKIFLKCITRGYGLYNQGVWIYFDSVFAFVLLLS